MTDLWARARAWWRGEAEPVVVSEPKPPLSAENKPAGSDFDGKIQMEEQAFTTGELRLRFRVPVPTEFTVYGSAAVDNAPET